MTTERPASPGPRPAGARRSETGSRRRKTAVQRRWWRWWRTRRRPGWLSAQTRQASLLCAAQDLHLLRGQGEAHRLQGCGQAEALHIGPAPRWRLGARRACARSTSARCRGRSSARAYLRLSLSARITECPAAATLRSVLTPFGKLTWIYRANRICYL